MPPAAGNCHTGELRGQAGPAQCSPQCPGGVGVQKGTLSLPILRVACGAEGLRVCFPLGPLPCLVKSFSSLPPHEDPDLRHLWPWVSLEEGCTKGRRAKDAAPQCTPQLQSHTVSQGPTSSPHWMGEQSGCGSTARGRMRQEVMLVAVTSRG